MSISNSDYTSSITDSRSDCHYTQCVAVYVCACAHVAGYVYGSDNFHMSTRELVAQCNDGLKKRGEKNISGKHPNTCS